MSIPASLLGMAADGERRAVTQLEAQESQPATWQSSSSKQLISPSVARVLAPPLLIQWMLLPRQ